MSGTNMAERAQKQKRGNSKGGEINLFKQVRDTTIIGGSFEIHPPRTRNGLDKLLEHVAIEAFHNSVTSYDLPQCYPGTREAIKKDLVEWVENVNHRPIYYLHAPAGSGKTAIAKMLADHFDNPADDYKNKLLASFFFSRSVQGQNNTRQLITTIAFQMAINIPSTAPFIAKAVLQDPSIFHKDLLSQLTTLIIQPLGEACQTTPQDQLKTWPQLIIIDGLDECIGEPKDNAQVQVLRIIARVAQYSQLFPFAIFLSCRPEMHIRREFQDHPLARMSVKVSLSNKYDSDQDIRHFFTSEFRDIRSRFSRVVKLPLDWPGQEAIDFLVQKSSGHFIYPSVVIKYIRAFNKNPIDRLNVILGLAKQSNDEKPFAQLDAFYLHYLESIGDEDRSTAMEVFKFTLAVSVLRPPMPRTAFNPIPTLRNENWKYILMNLEDILIKFTTDGHVEFLHDSFVDFLLDPNRSGKYHVNLGNAHATIVTHALNYIKDGIKESPSQPIMYLHHHMPLSAPTKALQDSLHNLLEPSITTKIIESFIQFPERCHWECVTDLAGILQSSPFKDAKTTRTDYLLLVKDYVSQQIPKYSNSPLNCLVTLSLSPAVVNDYLPLFRNSNTNFDGQPADSTTSIIWSALNLLDETTQKVDRGSLNLFRLLTQSGPNTNGIAKTVREFIRESGYNISPDICAKICTTLLKARFSSKREISNRGLVLVLNFFRFIIVPLLKEAAPSEELYKQLKIAKDHLFSACDPSITWMKEDLTRIWLEVDALRHIKGSETNLFKQVRDTTIIGGSFEIHPPKVRNGLDKLLEHVAIEAFHNSVTSYDLPQCYPGTREAIKKDLVEWVENVNRHHPIYYLHAPAGSGKTAIAKMLADHFDNPADDYKNKLLASFFFSRSVQGQNNTRQLITTIAFQMAINIPSTAPFIAKAVLQDLSIFHKDLLSQLTTLIIQPMEEACQTIPQDQLKTWPQLIIIDGLDECIGEPKDNAQVQVLRIIARVAQYSQLFPFAIFLSCRPEMHIRREFQDHPLARMSVKVSLSNKYDSDQDIRHFFTSEFRDIRSRHSRVVKLPPDWPGQEAIDFLVQKSSGHFIYPSVVIKYIRIFNKNPIDRLNMILGLAKQSNDEKPFAQLDALYLHNLESIGDEDRSTAMEVFKFTLAVSVLRPPMPRTAFNPIPTLRNENWKYILMNLEDILIKFTTDGHVEFLHDSFVDFLLDPNRSGKYHVNLGNAHATIVTHALNYIKDGIKESPSQPIMYLHRHLPLSAPTKALQDSLHNLLEPSITTKIIESFIQFPERCHWECVTDLANILQSSPFEDAPKMRTDYLLLVKNYVSQQIPKYKASPLDCLITLLLSPVLDYLALFRNSNTAPDCQPADSITSIILSTLNLLDETAQKVDGCSLNLFRLLKDSGPNAGGFAETVREFIRESGHTLTLGSEENHGQTALQTDACPFLSVQSFEPQVKGLSQNIIVTVGMPAEDLNETLFKAATPTRSIQSFSFHTAVSFTGTGPNDPSEIISEYRSSSPYEMFETSITSRSGSPDFRTGSEPNRGSFSSDMVDGDWDRLSMISRETFKTAREPPPELLLALGLLLDPISRQNPLPTSDELSLIESPDPGMYKNEAPSQEEVDPGSRITNSVHSPVYNISFIRDVSNVSIIGSHINFTTNILHQDDGVRVGLHTLYSKGDPTALCNSYERQKRMNQQMKAMREWGSQLLITSSSTREEYPLSVPRIKTRDLEAVVKDVLIWLYSVTSSHSIMWLYDESEENSRTSLIGQCLANFLGERRDLTASYFYTGGPFSQAGTSHSGTDGRHNPSSIIPTMAYELTRRIPEIEIPIALTAANDPWIFDLSLNEQMKKLIVDPLQAASKGNSEKYPQLFLIHGLEDCNDDDFQELFLDAFRNSLTLLQQSIPQKLILLGRHTSHLRGCFSKPDMQEIVRHRLLPVSQDVAV